MRACARELRRGEGDEGDGKGLVEVVGGRDEAVGVAHQRDDHVIRPGRFAQPRDGLLRRTDPLDHRRRAQVEVGVLLEDDFREQPLLLKCVGVIVRAQQQHLLDTARLHPGKLIDDC
eukprot:scaffold25014_cov62-Isochrysis_galbana.AAC.2